MTDVEDIGILLIASPLGIIREADNSHQQITHQFLRFKNRLPFIDT